MVNQSQIDELQDTLRRRRKEIFQTRLGIDVSWKELHEPEVEPEEAAQKEKMAQGLDALDTQEKKEIEAIDMALHRIGTGSYGICTSCGKDISLKRLQALPWAERCIDCASSEEGVTPAAELFPSEKEESPYASMSDEDLVEAIWDEIRDRGKIDTEELEISCEEGLVLLEGAMPSHKQHARLMNLLEDIMGLDDVEDNLRIEHVSWERRDRTSDEDEDENGDPMLFSDDDDDGWEPPEDFVPERES